MSIKKVLLVLLGIAICLVPLIVSIRQLREFSEPFTKSDGSRVRVGTYSMIVPARWGYLLSVEPDHLHACQSSLRYSSVFHVSPSSEESIKPLELSTYEGRGNNLRTDGTLFVRTASGQVFAASFSLLGEHDVVPADLLAAFNSIQDEQVASATPDE